MGRGAFDLHAADQVPSLAHHHILNQQQVIPEHKLGVKTRALLGCGSGVVKNQKEEEVRREEGEGKREEE